MRPRRTAAVALALMVPLQGLANPTGPSVVSGSASISSTGNTLTVANSSGAIINWLGFSIAVGEITNFVQPSGSSTVLNRVTGGNVSAIYGVLSSNGRVFLVNPNGVLFGPTAQVNVGGLVASSLNISDGNFLSGNYQFAANGPAGSVINQGTLNAPNGGFVALLAPNVQVTGTISAGTIALGAGDPIGVAFAGGVPTGLTVGSNLPNSSIDVQGTLAADNIIVNTGIQAGGSAGGSICPASSSSSCGSGVFIVDPIALSAGGVITVSSSGGVQTLGSIASGRTVSLTSGYVSIAASAGAVSTARNSGGPIGMPLSLSKREPSF